MTLDELITALETEDPDLVLPPGFGNPDSYRGYYEQLAFKPIANVTVGQMLADARRAHGSTYEGWKGGEYTMNGYTDCWIAERGHLGEEIGPILLTLLLTAGQLDDATRAKLAGFQSEWTTPGERYEVTP